MFLLSRQEGHADHELFDLSYQVEVDYLRFCFIKLLRNELTEVTAAWNHYIISDHRYDGLSEGPDIIFFLPHTCYEQKIICIKLVMMMM